MGEICTQSLHHQWMQMAKEDQKVSEKMMESPPGVKTSAIGKGPSGFHNEWMQMAKEDQQVSEKIQSPPVVKTSEIGTATQEDNEAAAGVHSDSTPVVLTSGIEEGDRHLLWKQMAHNSTPVVLTSGIEEGDRHLLWKQMAHDYTPVVLTS